MQRRFFLMRLSVGEYFEGDKNVLTPSGVLHVVLSMLQGEQLTDWSFRYNRSCR